MAKTYIKTANHTLQPSKETLMHSLIPVHTSCKGLEVLVAEPTSLLISANKADAGLPPSLPLCYCTN